MSLEVPITLAPRYSVSVSLASPTGGALELLPPQTAIVAQLQPILRGEPGPAWPSAGVQAASEAARDAALAAEAQAENAATAASASAGAAAAARTAAEGAATSASGSAATATAQASIASTKAGEAATSASTASTQATAATAQASIASTKATEAAASAAAAASSVAPTLHAGAAKATPDDADEFGYLDSASSWALVKATWAQLKAALKTSFDTVYLPQTGGTLAGGVVTASSPVLNITQTWNNPAAKFVGMLNNITNTASASDSLIEDWQIGGSSRFSISSLSGANVKSTDGSGKVLTMGSIYGTSYFSVGGGATLNWNGGVFGCQAGIWVGYDTSALKFGNSSDVILLRDAANTLAQRNGLNAQTFRLYNTYTDASNYERAFMRWNANVLEIGTEALGTGSNRALWLKAMGATIKWDGNSFQWGTAAAMFAAGLSLASNVIVAWSDTYNGGLGGYKTAIGRSASGLVEITNGSTGAYRDLILRNLTAAGYQELGEMTAPAAPATNNARIYAEDNGAGKTRLMARFATGAAVQIAIEP